MFTLFTGLPGAGKTLNMLEYVDTHKQFKGRDVYFYKIKGCNIEGWIEIEEEDFLQWYKFIPDNAVLVIDECQKYWRAGTPTKSIPDHLTEIEEHRHKGIDIVATCQHPAQLHTMAKVLVTVHRHYTRPKGLEGYRAYEYEGVKSNPESATQKKLAVVINGDFNSDYFDKYESASLHTETKRISKKIYVYAALIPILLFSSIGFAIYKIKSTGNVEEANEITTEVDSIGSTASKIFYQKTGGNSDYLTREELIEMLTPLIKNMPDSAPIYSNFYEEAKDYPRGQYIVWTKSVDTCVTYSQQATKMDVDINTCNYRLENGRDFDFRVEPTEYNENEAEARSEAMSVRATDYRILTKEIDTTKPRTKVVPTYPNMVNENNKIRWN